MITIKDSTFRGIRVHLDNITHVNCTFENCVIVYSGAGPVGLQDCKINNCTWAFDGAATNTINFLTVMYKFAPQLIEETFKNIRGGKHPEPPPEFPDTIL